jgi:hypothetical protein
MWLINQLVGYQPVFMVVKPAFKTEGSFVGLKATMKSFSFVVLN